MTAQDTINQIHVLSQQGVAEVADLQAEHDAARNQVEAHQATISELMEARARDQARIAELESQLEAPPKMRWIIAQDNRFDSHGAPKWGVGFHQAALDELGPEVEIAVNFSDQAFAGANDDEVAARLRNYWNWRGIAPDSNRLLFYNFEPTKFSPPLLDAEAHRRMRHVLRMTREERPNCRPMFYAFPWTRLKRDGREVAEGTEDDYQWALDQIRSTYGDLLTEIPIACTGGYDWHLTGHEEITKARKRFLCRAQRDLCPQAEQMHVVWNRVLGTQENARIPNVEIFEQQVAPAIEENVKATVVWNNCRLPGETAESQVEMMRELMIRAA